MASASVEEIKRESRYLRGKIIEELANSEGSFSKETIQLLKFHGMYQQDNRDDRRKGAKEKSYSLMLRGRIPGGLINSNQYLVWDRISENYADSTLRLTSRQSIQLHAVLKKNVKTVIQDIKNALLTTEAACGDIVRNVTMAINPLGLSRYKKLRPYVDYFSDYFKAKSNAYNEIWLDGIKLHEEHEPVYGEHYLPRKFKVAFTVEGDNSVDILTNDLSFAATFRNDDEIDGYHVFVGGGLGMTHRKPETYPRLADHLGWISQNDLIAVSEAIITSFRDFGNRENRKQARLKYLIDSKGFSWFKEEVEKRSTVEFLKREIKEWAVPDYSGWHKHDNDNYSFGLIIDSGRIKDSQNQKLKSALREIAGTYDLLFQITADQNLLISGINSSNKEKIKEIFKAHNIEEKLSNELRKKALACPALPTCGLAITEAERILPELLDKINSLLKSEELDGDAPLFRISGCPNGCSRPYSAEIALVGRSKDQYSLFLGGSFNGTRLAKLYKDLLHFNNIESEFASLFKLWKDQRKAGERFGDYINRIGFDKIKSELGE